MTTTMQQVRAKLDPDEPGYQKPAQDLGPDALPHLELLIRQSNATLASRSVYLASLIDHADSAAVVGLGMKRTEATVRVAVAAAAGNLDLQFRGSLLLPLLDEDDVGVRKVALPAVPAAPDAVLAAKIEELAGFDKEPALRSLAREKLDQSGPAQKSD